VFALFFAFAGSVLAVPTILGIMGTVPKIEKRKFFLAPLAKISSWGTHHFPLPCFSLLQPPSKGVLQVLLLLLEICF
jgi:hypothetical protein